MLNPRDIPTVRPTEQHAASTAPEARICDCLRDLSIELHQLGFTKHGWLIRMAAEDLVKLARLEAECRPLSPKDTLELLLGSLDAGLSNGKRGA